MLLIFGTIPVEYSRKRNVLTWNRKLTSSKKHLKKYIREVYKDICEFKKDYQPRAYVIKKADDKIVVSTTDIFSRWEQFYSTLLNVHQIASSSEICTTNILDPKYNSLQDLQKYTSLGEDQSPSELIQASKVNEWRYV